MNSTLLIDKRDTLWENFENCILKVTEEGLIRLRKKFPSIPATTVYGNHLEDVLTDVLRQSIIEVLFETRESNKHCKNPPVFNAPNQSSKPSDLTSVHILKKPDLQWFRHNDLASSHESYQVTYSIECKRLGESKLSALYVDQGVKRFISSDHRYGEGFPSAAMLGYVLKDDLQKILDEVNECATTNTLPTLILNKGTLEVEKVSFLIHQLQCGIRTQHAIDLRHLWIDLRFSS